MKILMIDAGVALTIESCLSTEKVADQIEPVYFAGGVAARCLNHVVLETPTDDWRSYPLHVGKGLDQ